MRIADPDNNVTTVNVLVMAWAAVPRTGTVPRVNFAEAGCVSVRVPNVTKMLTAAWVNSVKRGAV